jgi:4-hydroxyphenylacetate 3-monooxygenase
MDGRTVYLEGKLVDDVTTDVAFPQCSRFGGIALRLSGAPENIELKTFMPEGGTRRVNRCWQMPRNYDELVQLVGWVAPWETHRIAAHAMGRRKAFSPQPDGKYDGV